MAKQKHDLGHRKAAQNALANPRRLTKAQRRKRRAQAKPKPAR